MQDKPLMPSRLSRREFLERGAYGAAGLLLADRLVAPARGAAASAPAVVRKPAKAVIQVWLWGGLSQLDSFDPKPGAGREYCGQYKPIATNVPGIEICQMLPLLAKIADKYALLRGMTHGNNGHETAAYLVQAGRKASSAVCPGIGAIVSYFKGYNGGYTGMLPPYITVTTPQGRFSESGFLGSKYKPFSTGGDPSKTPFVVEGIVAEHVTEERQKDRRTLLGDLDRLAKEQGDDPLVKSVDANQQQAYAMILGDAGKTFDVSREKPEVRDRYGHTKFGQSCLLARRLVAQGVPFVTINHGGWDTHKQHFQAMGGKLPELDKALSALLQDLADQGLLDSTIVWVSGEFGRTPKILWEAPWNGGRGHYGKAFSALVAGGGFRGGRVVGKTDERGEIVIERPIYPWDLLGSMYALLGIDGAARLMTTQGEKICVSPLADNEIPAKETGGLLREIM
ncbi:MAG: DUF1501 domain-containing protein [Kiritimatiellaeota bacterium]|nr:DUF1501 domain-containing protein [Kiritimatiellota bacterium]